MKIKCPHCLKTTELEHVEYNSLIECVCLQTFQVNEETVVEEFTEIDSRIPEQIGPYPISGFIAFGGMGKVYKGFHPQLQIPVAVKLLRMQYMTDQSSCDRFLQSARISAKIVHPNIVRIYDCGYDENQNLYLVMEYIPRGSAQDILEQHGTLEPDQAALIMLEVCTGLMEAEKLGIVHRDIKPENIMFGKDGAVKILDLGLSKISGDKRLGKKSITANMTSLGTPQYMSPEQALNASDCDSRTDVYSIGVTLYQLCTGKLPFESDDLNELRRMHAQEPPLPPSKLLPSLRSSMESIILRCLQKKRENRYSCMEELALDLEAYLKNHILPSTLKKSDSNEIIPEQTVGQKTFCCLSGRQWLEVAACTGALITGLLAGFFLMQLF